MNPKIGDTVLVKIHGSEYVEEPEVEGVVTAIHPYNHTTVGVKIGKSFHGDVHHSEGRLPEGAWHSGARSWRWPKGD